MLVPIALAVLLTVVLTPPVTWLERWIGRVPAVLTAVTLVFIVLGIAGWDLARQMDRLADDLPTYRVNIPAKMPDVRGVAEELRGSDVGIERGHRVEDTRAVVSTKDGQFP